LIHWEPNVVADAQGNTIIKFFNRDIAGKVLVICEGVSINGEGIIGQNETSYDIVE